MPIRSRHPADVMRSYLAAVQSGDHERAFGFFADDIVVNVPGRSVYAGERRGRYQVVEHIHAPLEHSDDVEVTMIDMLASDCHVALIVQERFEGAGRRANVYRVENDRIVEVWIFEGDQYAVDEYLAGIPVK